MRRVSVPQLMNMALAVFCFFVTGAALAGRIHSDSIGMRALIGTGCAAVGLRRLLMFIFEEREIRRRAREGPSQGRSGGLPARGNAPRGSPE